MSSINFHVSRNILLTGAGFTHNFGGFLAKTMWAEIHNHLQRFINTRNSPLIKLIKDEFDYEKLYQRVVNGTEYSKREKSDFTQSVLHAYDILDKAIIAYYQSHYPLNCLRSMNDLLLRMMNSKGEKVFFFTLNQDLFVERYFMYYIDEKPVFPGIKLGNKLFDIATVPSQQELEKSMRNIKMLGELFYIKLHGSYKWRDSENQNKLVIGTNKQDQIEVEPIFKRYFQLFKDVLSLPERRLLIIGYGFRDSHINEVIAESIKKYNLKIFIICPTYPEDFLNKTLKYSGDYKDTIWDAVGGYYPHPFEKIFHYDDSLSLVQAHYYDNLVKDFIDD